ncbi:MAG: hypothetical protein JNM39_04910 [Bdellovibrionaceae bacterium]|nr:hypothetical protein [Pseudobdellovibrionaceae bacterium]
MNNYVGRLQRATLPESGPFGPHFDEDGNLVAVLSFTSKYRPFIPTRSGYNREEDRCYIVQSRLTRELGLDLQKTRIELEDIPGGRVFIAADCTYIKLRDGKRVEVSSIGLGPYADPTQYI